MAIILFLCKKMTALFFASALFLASSVAEGATVRSITGNGDSNNDISQDSVPSSVLMRADADIQIRRIKNFMAFKKSNTDKEIEQLEKLQKILHGQN